MSVIIEKVLGGTKVEIESKKFNIWIGVSLGNKYFTKGNLAEYIRYALAHTREDVLLVIPERLQAVNIEVRNKKPKLSAHRKAWRLGDEKEAEIKEIISLLPDNDKKRVNLARWHDIKTKYFEYRTEVIIDEFEKKGEFYQAILEVVRDNTTLNEKTFQEEEEEVKLAKYILLEIPVFLNGANYGGPRSGKRYECILYPGIGKLDYLIMDLREGKKFPELSNKLYIDSGRPIIIAEAYVK